MKKYKKDNNQILLNSDNLNSIAYSDGDEVETYLLNLLEKATDLSTGSEELYNGIKDWPTLYHLSPQRADLLRPFSQTFKGKEILEIGSGAGAITRFLAEQEAIVTALEGSYRRALITKARSRSLSNVKVICDNFSTFDSDCKYDYVTLIGVLEYSNLFIKGDVPPLQMLQQVKSYLKPGGTVIIAIENKLGLKYWTGSPEDHTGKKYTGIEGKYNAGTAITFGKAELSNLLDQAGFSEREFLYPFPDYKLPEIILKDKAFNCSNFSPESLLFEKLDYFQKEQHFTNFSATLAAKELARNKLLSDFSNSFLLIGTSDRPIVPDNVLAYTYNSGRKKHYCKENKFVQNGDNSIRVIREYYHKSDSLPVTGTVTHHLYEEEYSTGSLLIEKLLEAVSTDNWSAQSVIEWAERYYIILRNFSFEKEGKCWLPGKYLDLTPFNIVINSEKEHLFDLEWNANEAIPFSYVFFRGIYYSLNKIQFFNLSLALEQKTLIGLTVKVISTFMPFSDGDLKESVERETGFLAQVNIGMVIPFDTALIHFRETGEKDKDILPLKQTISMLRNRLNNQISHFKTEKRKTSFLVKQEELLQEKINYSESEINRLLSDKMAIADQLTNVQENFSKKIEEHNTLTGENKRLAEQNLILNGKLDRQYLESANNTEIIQQLTSQNKHLNDTLKEQVSINSAGYNKIDKLIQAVATQKELLQVKDAEINDLKTQYDHLLSFSEAPISVYDSALGSIENSSPDLFKNLPIAIKEKVIKKKQAMLNYASKVAKYVYWTATFQLNSKRKQELNRINVKEEVNTVKRSGLFDVFWYLEQYPDVKNANMDPVEHFLWHGFKEGRNPNPYFDTKWYLSQNKDVAEHGFNPLVHYIQYGANENRKPHPNSILGNLCKESSSKTYGVNPLSQALWQFVKAKPLQTQAIPGPTYFPSSNGYNGAEELTREAGHMAKLQDNFKISNRKYQPYKVAYISGFPNSPSHNYRVKDQLIALNECGIKAGWVHVDDINLFRHLLSFTEVVVLFRVAMNEKVKEIINVCKKSGVLIVYDTDDYVFDPAIANEKFVDGIRFLNDHNKELYNKGVLQYKEALLQSDAGIFTTTELANASKKLGIVSHIIRNGYADSFYKASTIALLAKRHGSIEKLIRIGYASGTMTHQKDFRVVSKAIAHLLKEHPNARFRIIGMLDLDEFPELKTFRDQVEIRPLVPHDELPYELINFDINIAPLEVGNPFCEAKSELKYFEAGLLKIPTIATPTRPFQQAIQHGDNGFLANDEAEWYDTISMLIADDKLRAEVGERAFVHSLANYGKDAKRNEVLSVFNKLFRLRKEKLKASLSTHYNQTITIMTCPMDKGSGGHAIIIDMAKWLAGWGHTVSLVFTGTSVDYASAEKIEKEFDFDISRMRAVINADLPCDTNIVIATFWTTVYTIEKSRMNFGRKYYLMLDYEPYFYPMSTDYILSLNTYYKDFRRISWGPWIKNILLKRHAIDHTRTFPYYYNKKIYNNNTVSKRSSKKIIFFGRPTMPRRCFDLGLQVLQRYRELYGDAVEIVFFGSLTLNHIHIPFKHTQLGVLTPFQLAELYRTATVGIVFSPTNPSKAPFEMMACGLPVIDLDIEENAANYGDQKNVFLLHPDPDNMAHRIYDIVKNASEREEIARNGQRFVSEFPDESEAARKLFELFADDANNDLVNTGKLSNVSGMQRSKNNENSGVIK